MKARWIEFNVVGEADRPSGAGRFGLYADLSASGYAELHLQDCNGNRHRLTEQGVFRLTEITPDVALCTDCRRELFDPANRLYRYPFINCTSGYHP